MRNISVFSDFDHWIIYVDDEHYGFQKDMFLEDSDLEENTVEEIVFEETTYILDCLEDDAHIDNNERTYIKDIIEPEIEDIVRESMRMYNERQAQKS